MSRYLVANETTQRWVYSTREKKMYTQKQNLPPFVIMVTARSWYMSTSYSRNALISSPGCFMFLLFRLKGRINIKLNYKEKSLFPIFPTLVRDRLQTIAYFKRKRLNFRQQYLKNYVILYKIF